MSICAICRDKIEDGYPCDDKHLSYDYCEDYDFEDTIK